jgi:threonylcarbamoyladenosine tRNA methylthiotransferase MtaB
VPDARGRPESKALSQALEEARALAAAGIQELVLCGIRLGAYGSDSGNGGLVALLRALREIDLPRIRLSSVEPMDLKQDLLDEMSDHPRLCRHLHLPLQSGDDAVLAAMNRGYTRSVFADLVSRVRRMWPDVAISTDVMVGFPGETEAQFEATARFAREVGFARLHVFPYSRRPGTPAAERADQTSPEVTRGRAAELLSIAEELSARAAAAWVGREVAVLFEQRAADGRLTGLTEHYLRLRACAPEEWIGRLVALTPHAAARGELLAGDRDAR